MFESRIHANDLRIRFAIDQAWKSVECSTPHASTRVQGLAVFFLQQDSERQWEGMMAAALQIVVELLNARRVADGRVAIRSACWTFRGINSVFSVDVIQMLRFGVIRLEVLVAERPCR